MLEWVEGPDVLDVGCAGGAVAPESPEWLHGRLRTDFPTIVGIDLSADRIEEMRALGFTSVHCADAQDFQLERSFDTVVAGELIEHLSAPAAFLGRAANHLKPGGRIVLTTPYPFSAHHVLYALLKYPRTCSNSEHAMWFCPSTLPVLAARVGLKVTHWELLEDYPGGAGLKTKVFTVLVRPLLPRRLRCNAMLFVLTRDSGGS